MKLALLHFYCLNRSFLSTLATKGCELEFISLPAFALQTLDKEYLFNLWPKCFLFDIASWNTTINLSSNQHDHYSLSPAEQLHVLLQSERLTHLKHLSIHQRTLLIDQQVLAANELLSASRINRLAFGGVPHSMADYVLCLIAKKMDITITIHQDLPMVKGNHFLYDQDLSLLIDRYDFDHMDYQDPVTLNNDQLEDDHYTPGKLKPREERLDYWAQTYAFLAQQGHQTIFDRLNEILVENKLASQAIEYYHRWQAYITTTSAELDPTLDVVFYLHVEPESVVNPTLGPEMPRQIDFVRKLRSSLDVSIRLLVKEHPAMFLAAWSDSQLEYNFYRSDAFLQAISRLPNTYLIDAESLSSTFLDSTITCASIMGTVHTEALCAGAPVIAAEVSPLKGMPGVHILSSKSPSNSINSNLIHHLRDDAASLDKQSVLTHIKNRAQLGTPNGEMNMYYELDENTLALNGKQLALSIIRSS